MERMQRAYRIKIVCSFMALLLSGPATAQCLEYEPKVVRLTGTLVRETHPGRPNYESIASGDEPETIWVLKLQDAICVGGAIEADSSESGQAEIQLVLEQAQYNKYRSLLGQNVTVRGNLFHGHTGHHHKRLLPRTIEIKKNA